MTRYPRLADLQALVGQEIGASDWVVVDQARIALFADATGDHQWIHVDPLRAAAGPYRATIAHGFLTLSLLPLLSAQAFEIGDQRLGLNYGLDKVRFPSPVRAGSRLRGRFVLESYEPIDGGAQLRVRCTMEVEGDPKPACVALSVTRRFV